MSAQVATTTTTVVETEKESSSPSSVNSNNNNKTPRSRASRPPQRQRGAKNSSPKTTKDDKAIWDSIVTNQTSVLISNKIPALTIYVPTASVGAVIGRKGQNIAALQKQMSSSSLRVSVVGQHDPPDNSLTFSPTVWSEHWTPVVIRCADCRTLLQTAQKILHLARDVHDGVVLDLPIATHKHGVLVGKRGIQLATLSATHNVRIFVPHREEEVENAIVQLEGTLEQVRLCLRDLLQTLARSCELERTIIVQETPVRWRSRPQSRTQVRKRRVETTDEEGNVVMAWQVTVRGPTEEQVQAAIEILEQYNANNANTNNRKLGFKGNRRVRPSGRNGRRNPKEEVKKNQNEQSPKNGGEAKEE